MIPSWILHLKIGKFLKGAESVRGLVEPLLWNPGYCDAKATLPIYPIYDENNPAPKREEKAFNDTVKKSKKGPLILLILILLVILLLAVIVGIVALIVWAVVAIVHTIAGFAALGLL